MGKINIDGNDPGNKDFVDAVDALLDKVAGTVGFSRGDYRTVLQLHHKSGAILTVGDPGRALLAIVGAGADADSMAPPGDGQLVSAIVVALQQIVRTTTAEMVCVVRKEDGEVALVRLYGHHPQCSKIRMAGALALAATKMSELESMAPEISGEKCLQVH